MAAFLALLVSELFLAMGMSDPVVRWFAGSLVRWFAGLPVWCLMLFVLGFEQFSFFIFFPFFIFCFQFSDLLRTR